MNKDIEYVIYGVNRVAKDFLYIFDQIKVKCFAEDYSQETEFLGKKVVPIVSLDKELENIIICDFEHYQKIDTLIKLGYQRKINFWVEEDFFDDLDTFWLPEDKKIAIWGTGVKAEKFLAVYNGRIDCFIDNNYYNFKFHNIDVYHPDQIKNWEKYYIIIAVGKEKPIREQLKELGVAEESIVNYQNVLQCPSSLLRQTIFDKSCYRFECNTMLNHFEVFEKDSRCCCSTFVEVGLGEVCGKTLDETWNSIIHKIMCLSTENKTYSFCNKKMCPFFIGKSNNTEIVDLNENYKKMEERPKVVLLGFDNTCNLFCDTCRKEMYIAKGQEYDDANEIAKYVRKNLLENCEFLIAAGHGEVLLSKAYRDVYMDSRCDNIANIRILSNGTLLNEKKWNEFKYGKNGKIMLTVSIDAATEGTYNKIRCGGNFEHLKENMKFVSKLRKTGELSYFRMNFVVQKNNYQEMIPFVKWGLELGVDEIFFTKLLNWGTYTKEEFKNISMMEEDNVTPKPELRKILENPIMKNPVVDFGTIQYAHEEVTLDKIENYYMWELERKVSDLFT